MKKKSTLKRAQKAITNPKKILIHILIKCSTIFPDKLYLKLLFRLKAGYRLNLKNPQTFNEKLQWLKLYYRDPLLPKLVDKYEYKEFVREKIGDEYNVKTYGVWNSFDEIDFNSLPKQFVLKTTHDQGGVLICKDKTSFDVKNARKMMNKHLKRNLFYLMREWPYKYVKARIIAEELLVGKDNEDLWDYKFYCFDGVPKYMYISMGRQGEVTYFYNYDMNFNLLDLERPIYKPGNKKIKKPKNWDKMIALAEVLSEGQPHVRIDFYDVNDRIYAGEYTLFQGGGMMPFIPKKWDYEYGKQIILPEKNN